jgi:hypothetical protein
MRDRRQVGPQDWFGGVEMLVVLPGGDEDRAAGFLRVVKHAHGVAKAGRDVKIGHGELAGGLRVAVGHANHGRLLQAEHIAQLVVDRERVHQRQFGGAGAEQNLDAFLLEQFEKGAFSGHRWQEILPRDAGPEEMIAISSAVGATDFVMTRIVRHPYGRKKIPAIVENFVTGIVLFDDDRLVLSQRRHRPPVQIQMSLHELRRRERHPLVERNIHEASAAEHFQKAERFGAEILDIVRHSMRNVADVAGLVIERPRLAARCEDCHAPAP